MSLQNRVTPFGELLADSSRGLFMGNRGGRIHDDARRLSSRRWASKQWICCALAFRGRHRAVWGDSYTELFFLDEVTALSAGHRPCFECRRADATAFAQAWGRANGTTPRAPDMDAILHAERLVSGTKRLHLCSIDALPDGAMIVLEGVAYAIRGDALLRWSPAGYTARTRRPHHARVDTLTPPAIISALAAGYRPRWHRNAEAA
jgi:hypothetical protein